MLLPVLVVVSFITTGFSWDASLFSSIYVSLMTSSSITRAVKVSPLSWLWFQPLWLLCRVVFSILESKRQRIFVSTDWKAIKSFVTCLCIGSDSLLLGARKWGEPALDARELSLFNLFLARLHLWWMKTGETEINMLGLSFTIGFQMQISILLTLVFGFRFLFFSYEFAWFCPVSVLLRFLFLWRHAVRSSLDASHALN